MNDQAAWTELIRRIHQAARPCVVVVTGGGATAISMLLAVPGASHTILDARVPYSSAALVEWLGRTPEKFCDERTALAMATVACARAERLLDGEAASHSPLGVSCTAALASDRPKRGDHRCFIAIHSEQGTTSYSVTLTKNARTRSQEESLTTQLILQALARADQAEPIPDVDLLPTDVVQVESCTADPQLRRIVRGEVPVIWSLPDGSYQENSQVTPVGILSGAFDPLHIGHQELVTAAENILGGLVAYELSLTNVDKPPLDYLTIARRRRQFVDRPLALTNCPLYSDKIAAFPGVTFVIGVDTALRIVDPKYYGHDHFAMARALDEISRHGCRFLVASRRIHDRLMSLKDVPIPTDATQLFQELPIEMFRVDISSTELRRESE